MDMHAAATLDRLSLGPRKGRAARLRLGLPGPDDVLGGGLERDGLHEIRAPLARGIGAATGLVAALLAQLCQGPRGRVLWVTDPAALPDAGLLCPDGLAQYGLDPGALTLVHPVDLKSALWAADEGARCTDLAAVVLHVKGNPKLLDRVATRRLMIRARDSGVMVLILRQSGEEEANAALTRWRVEPLPSPPDASFPKGIGLPCHRLVLERSRDGRSGAWSVTWNPKRKTFTHGPRQTEQEVPGPRLPAPAHRPDRPGALGQVVDLRRAT